MRSTHYKILLPEWVLSSVNDDELIKNTEIYLRRAYPDTNLVKIKDKFAICTRMF